MNAVTARLLIPLLMLAGASARSSADERTIYTFANLPSLGGTVSSGNSLNDLGWAAGTSNLPGDTTQHASLWISAATFARGVDLGTLGGPNSGVIWPVHNDVGWISGIAEPDQTDPLGERWSCSAFFPARTGKICRGVVWQAGTIRALPTL